MAKIRTKMTNIDRAKQFMPFNSLRGYYTLVREKERIKEDKKILSSEVISEINDTLIKINKGMMIEITYYDVDAYIKKEGMVSNIDPISQTITIVDNKINFKDILKISIN